ncbi:MAG: delta-60 repeat domain-containing protein [Flavobacteriales bacterium]|nr:delta-60 repeat domain-containing protein [Flavobacteriales bacterium]
MYTGNNGELWHAQVNAVIPYPGGRMLVGGYFRTFQGVERPGLAMIHADGRLDDSFPMIDVGSDRISGLYRLSDGRVMISHMGIGQQGAISVMSNEGVLEGSFTVITDQAINAICELPDGRLAIGGRFNQVNGMARSCFAVLDASGALDPTALSTTQFNGWVYELTLQVDASIMVGGRFTTVNGEARSGFASLGMDGALQDVDIGEWGTAEVKAIALDAQGLLLLGGTFVEPNAGIAAGILRFFPDGGLDGSWYHDSPSVPMVETIHIVHEDTILVGGRFSQAQGHQRAGIVRLDGNGVVDTSFNGSIRGESVPLISTILMLPSGEKYVAGSFDRVDGRFRSGIVQLGQDGEVVEGFNPGRGIGGYAHALLNLPDERIAIAGDFPSYNDVPSPYFAMLRSDGSLDPNFPADLGLNAPVDRMLLLPGGDLLLVGRFTTCLGQQVPSMVAITPLGSMVPNMNFPDILANRVVTATLGLPDGSVLMASQPSYTTGGYNSSLHKLRPNGSLDPTFQSPTMLGMVRTMCSHVGGMVVLAGNFTSYNGTAVGRVARIMANGTLDPGFADASALSLGGSAYTSTVLSDGRIVLGGYITSVNGQPARHLVGLLPNGHMDPDFALVEVSGMYANTTIVREMQRLPDDRVVVVGCFTHLDEVEAMCMAVIGPEGTRDASFNIGSGPDFATYGEIQHVALDAQGSYIITGIFDRIDGIARHRIARIHGGGGVGVEEVDHGSLPSGYFDAVGSVLTISDPRGGAVHDAQGRLYAEVQGGASISMRQAMTGVYTLHTRDGRVLRFVKP